MLKLKKTVTAIMRLPTIERCASWWRAEGFPVPPDVPGRALGRLSGDTVTFTWIAVTNDGD
jgi:hypothetical protein